MESASQAAGATSCTQSEQSGGIRLVNKTVVSSLSCSIDLLLVARRLVNIEFNPARFRAAIKRSRKYKAVILMFANGRLVSAGKNAEGLTHNICKRLQRIGYTGAHISAIRVVNKVYAGSVQLRLNLTAITSQHARATYTPELFSGVSVRLRAQGATLVAFSTGNFFLTGRCASRALANEAYTFLASNVCR